jgi:glycosyltransferase involved in cell wall biosynthesis
MLDQPLVSVIIPFANAERFLSETIESVLAQTIHNWELILVDDGATDRSSQIAQSYADASSGKTRYLRHEGHRNRGVTASRNLGVRKSHGEFLAFLDSDDVWLPSKLDHQLAAISACPDAGMVYGPSEYWYDWDPNQELHENNQIQPVAPGAKLYLPPELLTCSHPFGRWGAPCPGSLLLRRSAFDKVGGFVEEFNPGTFQLYEDTAFLTKLYLAVPVLVTDVSTDRYRCRADSIWHRLIGTSAEEDERRFYFRWLRRYLIQQGITDIRIWQAVRKTAWPYWLPLPAWMTRIGRRAQNRLRG